MNPTVVLKATNRRRTIFFLAGATSFMLYLHRYTWNLIRPELQAEYGFNNTELEWLGTAFYFTYAIGQVPSGIACDLFGPHLFLGGIIILWSLVLPLFALTGNLYGLGGARLMFGAAQAGGYPALGSVTRSWFSARNRTFVQGWVASFFGRGGGAVSSILMGSLLMGYFNLSWRWALLALSIPGVIFGILFLKLHRNTPEEDPQANEEECALIRGEANTETETRGVMSFRSALRNFSLRVMVFQQFLNAGADVVYTLVMGSYFKSLGVDDMGELGWLVSLPLIGGGLGGICGGFLNDWLIRRTGNRRWARSGVGLTGKTLAACTLFVAISQPTAAGVAYGLFVVKFFTDWSQPTVWGTCTDLGGRFSATVFSINNTSGNVGALVTPLVVGPLLDYFSVEKVIDGQTQLITNFTPMFVLVGGMYVVAGICWCFVDCTKPIEAPDEEAPEKAESDTNSEENEPTN